MPVNKNGDVKSQIHLYCNPKLYNDFKEAVKQYNRSENTDNSISEIIRELMKGFIKQHTPSTKGGVKYDNWFNSFKGLLFNYWWAYE